jgi:TPR repeat protein
MRRIAAALLGLIALSSPAWAGLDEGLAAYQRRDWAGAARELKPLADKGSPQAQARMGHMALFGLGMARDEVLGAKLIQDAARAGDPFAQHDLASAMLLGRAMPKDPASALVWYGRAAAQDYPDSLFALGEIYFNGIGISKDEAKGVDYYKRAADKGAPDAIDKLADLYWSGRAVPTDPAKAVELARRSADLKRPLGQFILGLAYLTGQGVDKNPAEAHAWFKKAADQGYAKAQHNLGYTYVTGTGTAKNELEGWFWLALSADRAPPQLKQSYEKERDAVGAKLAPQDLDRQRVRLAAWKPVPGNGGPPVVVIIQPAPPAAAPPSSLPPTPATVPPTPERMEKQQVRLSTGSGILISRDGSILTNAHVVDSCRAITIKPQEGAPVVASLSAKDAGNDLAVLKSALRQPDIATFRDDKPMRPGDDVVVVGYPLSALLSREANVTSGGISAMGGIHGDPRHYQITAPVQKGNSGGPLADTSGNVVGIVSSKLNAIKVEGQYGDLPQNINFAIKADVARKFLDIYGVKYETAAAPHAMSVADVGERVKKFTVFVECRVN